MEFISDGNIMKLSQHIIDKHHGKMYLPYEMIKDQFIVEDLHLVTGVGDVGCVGSRVDWLWRF